MALPEVRDGMEAENGSPKLSPLVTVRSDGHRSACAIIAQVKAFIMRHCLTDIGPQMDAERTLNDVGLEQAHVMRKFLKRADVHPDVIICSDFARAHDTAKIMQRGDTPIEVAPILRPDGDASKAWKLIDRIAKRYMKDEDDNPSILIVTHSPLIYEILATVAFAFSDSRVWQFHHGAIAYCNTTEGRFRWYVNPKLGAHMVKEDPKEVENPVGESAYSLMDPLVFAEGCIALAENLRVAHKAAAVDPLIAQLKRATQKRFRRQWTRVKLSMRKLEPRWDVATYSEVRSNLQAAIVIHDPAYHKVFDVVSTAAREHGATHVREQLGIETVREAAAKSGVVRATPPPRTADDLEDELDNTTDRETGTKLRDAFADVAAPLGFAAMLGVLRDQFAEYADGVEGQTSRAETVAVTEVSEAYHDGGHNAALEAPGAVEKLWETEDDACPTCEANADMGWIPEDWTFDSGDGDAPAHPNCRCSVSYRMAEPDEEE